MKKANISIMVSLLAVGICAVRAWWGTRAGPVVVALVALALVALALAFVLEDRRP